MHETKENLTRGIFHSKQRKSLKNVYEMSNFYSTTQTLFPSKKNSINQSQIDSFPLNKGEFYKTLGNSTSWGGWVRPQSKQACRKIFIRPQTSKGFRKQPTNKMLFSKVQNEVCVDHRGNSIMNSKRRSKKYEKEENPVHQYPQFSQLKEVQIVINKRGFDGSKKGPSVYKNKFETDLDDQFLELFAD